MRRSIVSLPPASCVRCTLTASHKCHAQSLAGVNHRPLYPAYKRMAEREIAHSLVQWDRDSLHGAQKCGGTLCYALPCSARHAAHSQLRDSIMNTTPAAASTLAATAKGKSGDEPSVPANCNRPPSARVGIYAKAFAESLQGNEARVVKQKNGVMLFALHFREHVVGW